MSFIQDEINKFHKKYSIYKFYFPYKKIRDEIDKLFNRWHFFIVLVSLVSVHLFTQISKKNEFIYTLIIFGLSIYLVVFLIVWDYKAYRLKKKNISTKYKSDISKYFFNTSFFNNKLIEKYVSNTEFNYTDNQIDFLLREAEKKIDNYNNKSFILKPLGIITTAYIFTIQLLSSFKVIENYFEVNINNITTKEGFYISLMIILIYILIILFCYALSKAYKSSVFNEREYKDFVNILSMIKLKKSK